MKKSIIIVNIVMAGGGDYALGKKIKDIARSTQADGVLFTVSVKARSFKSEREERFNPCKAVNYNHPVIIVSPYSIMPPALYHPFWLIYSISWI